MAADHFCLKWNNFHNSIVTVFESLQSSEELVDVTLMCEGQNVKAHKVILSACSPYFRNLFKEIPCQHPVIILKDVLHSDLVAILQFMYQGEVLITQDGLASFLKTAELLQVSGLAGNPATTRTTAIDTNLPTEINVPLRIPSPVIPLSPTSPAKSTTTIKNHASPVTESISKEIENIDTEQSVLSQFEAAIEPIQSCSYEPQEQMVIKTEADEVEFSEMDYTSMSHDHTNDSGPPTEEQSILERSLKAHGTQNLFILNEPNTRQIVEKEKLDRYMPSKSELFIKCPYCCKSMLKRNIKTHLKFCTFLKSNKPLRPEIEHNNDESFKNDHSDNDSTVSKKMKKSESVSCPLCDKFIKWKRNLSKHMSVCKYKPTVVEENENILEKRITRRSARKSLDCRPFLHDIEPDTVTPRKTIRKSLDCQNHSDFSNLDYDIAVTPNSLTEIRSINSTDSSITNRTRRISTRKSTDCRNCAGCS